MTAMRLVISLGVLLALSLSGCGSSSNDHSASTSDTTGTDSSGDSSSDSTPPPTSSEGSSSEPVDLGSPPASHTGFVDEENDSYYVFSASGYTKVTLSGMSEDADLEVYSGTSFGTSLCNPLGFGTEEEVCVVYCSTTSCSYGVVVEPPLFASTSYLVTLTDIGLRSTTFTATLPYSTYSGDASVLVTVREQGFTFSVTTTSGYVFVCEIGQKVIQGGISVNLDSNSFSGPLEYDTENYVPFNYDGCDYVYPNTDAHGDVFMVERMGLDPSRSFQFVFDSGLVFTLTPP